MCTEEIKQHFKINTLFVTLKLKKKLFIKRNLINTNQKNQFNLLILAEYSKKYNNKDPKMC